MYTTTSSLSFRFSHYLTSFNVVYFHAYEQSSVIKTSVTISIYLSKIKHRELSLVNQHYVPSVSSNLKSNILI